MLDQWLADILPGTVAPVTADQYGDVVRLYLKPRIGQIRLNQLAPSGVTRMLRDMEKSTLTRPHGCSANSRRLARSSCGARFGGRRPRARSLATLRLSLPRCASNARRVAR